MTDTSLTDDALTDTSLTDASLTVGALTVGALTADDLPDILNIDASAFGQDPPEDFMDELVVPWLELDRFVGARDAAATARERRWGSGSTATSRVTVGG